LFKNLTIRKSYQDKYVNFQLKILCDLIIYLLILGISLNEFYVLTFLKHTIMKKISSLLLIYCCIAITGVLAQNPDHPGNQDSKYRRADSPVDNISYWVKMAEDGIVQFNASIPVKPAEFITSKVKGDPIDQMSTDVCVWDETTIRQSENSVFIDPDNPEYVLNSNNSDIGGSIYGANYIHTADAGQTWAGSHSGAGGYNSGDPATAIARSGRQFVGSINNSSGQSCAYSDNGTTWTPVVISTTTDLLDKNHLMIDTRASGTYSGYLYSSWTRFQSGHANDTDIEFSRSTNNGVSWSGPINISNAIAAGSHNQGVNIQTGPNGEVYCVWAVYDDWAAGLYEEDALGFAKSTNGGSSFGAATRIHNNIKGGRSWNPVNDAGKNMRMNSFPSMAVDISGGAYNGYIYVVWANMGVPGTNTGTNMSVYCMRSTNGGTSWGTPVRVNQFYASDYAAFFPWITCDPVTGKLFCIFYDDRNLGSASTACEVWVAYSEDAGVSWSDFRVGDVSFTPAPMSGLASGYFGDYLGIAARDGWVYPCWTDNRSGRALTYVSPIQFSDYCIASGGCDEYISNVNIGSINNSSACEGYQNFTAMSTSIPVNSSAALIVTNGNPYGSDQCGVWVDWNNDGDFSDANEQQTVVGTPGGGPYTSTIAPPVGTALGTKTMRIRITYTGAVSPCGNTTYGEVEDYSINVSAMVPNVWDGSYNYYWHNANNWSLGHIPYTNEDVIMTTDGYHPPAVDIYNEECGTLTINAGAGLNIGGSAAYSLIVNGDITNYGSLNLVFASTDCYVRSYGDIFWESGSSGSMVGSSTIYLQGIWEYKNGANVYLGAGYVDFFGTGDSFIRSMDADSYLYHVRNNKTTELGHSAMSTFPCRITGNLYIYSGCNLTTYSSQEFRIGNFVNNMSGTIHLNSGTFVFDGASGASSFMAGDYFNNLTISSTGTTTFNNDITVNGNVVIESGTLSPGATTITVFGNWTNTVGTGGFNEGTGKVSLAGGNHQYIYNGEAFNILEMNKTGMDVHFPAGTTTTCATLDWLTTATGELEVEGGTFVANDLADNGIYGNYYITSAGGLMELHQDGVQYVDLNGRIVISNGTMNVYGGNGNSYWPYAANGALWMYGGVLDFKDVGITVYNSATYTLDDQITAGTVRTSGGFVGYRSDFTPTAGNFEFYGPGDNYLYEFNGCTLYNVNISKGAKEGENSGETGSVYDERSKLLMSNGSKANTIYLGTNFTITNDLTISAGSLILNGYQLNVGNDCMVYGSLVMTNAADILFVGTSSYDNLEFYGGSNSTLTAGQIYPASWIWSNPGAIVSSSTGNTIFFTGSNSAGIEVDGPGSVWGNVDVNKTVGTFFVYSYASSTELAGYFNIHAGNTLQMQGSSMIVHGTVTDDASSTVRLDYSEKGSNSQIMKANGGSESITEGSKGGSLVIDPDLTINGLWDVLSGNVLLHGGLTIASTGILNITSGSFIADKPYYASDAWQYIYGTLNLTSGLFEISHNSMRFESTAVTNISGGTVRCGFTFWATDPGVFDPSGGVVEFTGSDPYSFISCTNANWFNDFTVSKGSMIELWSHIIVKGNVNIVSGPLNTMANYGTQYDMYVGGHWTNTGGEAAFNEGTGTVFFNGTGALNHQDINGTEIFYNLTNAKTGGGHLRPNGITTVNNNYLANGVNFVTGTVLDVQNTLDLSTGELGLSASAPNVGVNNFTMGGILSVTNGNFTCTDVTNNGIFGTINLSSGSITLNQDALQYPDLNANVTINGGYMAINGGNGGSVWGWGSPCTINMTGGIFDFNNNGIYISNFYTLTENITNGLVKTNSMFYSDHVNFTPSGGTLELYGGSDNYIAVFNTSNLYNLLINKSGGDKELSATGNLPGEYSSESSSPEPKEQVLAAKDPVRPEFPATDSKSNTIYTSNTVRINGTTTVEEGTFLVDNYTTTCMNNITVNAGGKLSIGDFGTLAIENGRSLTVNNGGTLDLSGAAGGAATITRNTGYYTLNVESGGTIGAVYGVFEYMNTSGVNIKNGSIVDIVKPFNYCTFRLGQAGGRLMSIENNQTFYVENAVFPPNTWAGAYNVYKAANQGMVYFVTATGGFAGTAFEFDPNNRIFWTQRSLTLKAYMEGPFNGVNMNTTLNGILPLNHPFNPALPYFGNPMPDWYYAGAGAVGAIPNPNIVDWVLVELRDAPTAATALKATMVAQMPGFILNNGSIVSLDGASNLQFSNVIANNLFVVIYQRNHESIMNANLIPYGAGVFTYDYSTGAGQVYGGIAGHKEIVPGVWGMRSGDGDGNCDVLNADRDNVWDIQAGKTGYLPSDYNMNRQTNNVDKNDKWRPNLGTGSQVPN